MISAPSHLLIRIIFLCRTCKNQKKRGGGGAKRTAVGVEGGEEKFRKDN